MAKAEISWKRVTADGLRLQVYAHHVGRDWRFYAREQRYDQWQAVTEPPLEDWLSTTVYDQAAEPAVAAGVTGEVRSAIERLREAVDQAGNASYASRVVYGKE